MENRITNLEVNNFKSIKHIKMDCKRINIFIGKPNVGKSNILEALCLYLAQNCIGSQKIFQDYIRYEKLSNLFYDLDRKNQICINSNLGFAALRYHMNGINAYDIFTGPEISILDAMNESEPKTNINDKKAFFHNLISNYDGNNTNKMKPYYAFIDNDGLLHNSSYLPEILSPIKKYHFKTLSEHKNHFPLFLLPPYGDNLFTIIEQNTELWDEFASFFDEYGLELLLDKEFEKLDIQKKVGRYVTKIPYSLAADTLQRIIFNLAAIETNTDSILIFEEPENHSFPPYIKLFADRIIDNTSNQYFIATHSPYILQTLIEKCPKEDLSIFIGRYENYETKIKLLEEKEIQNILDTHTDIFFNLSSFEK